MRRVIVTGATGFLGGALARDLRDAGWQVLAHGRSEAGCARLQAEGFEVLRHDLSRPFDADPGQAAAMVHCAALSAPWGRMAAFRSANLDGTRTALYIAARAGVKRFVNIGTPSIYLALRDGLDIREGDPLPPPINAYAATKRAAEEMALTARELGPVSLRPRGIYGTGDETLLPRLLAAARAGPLPRLNGGRAAIDLTHISDVIGAVHAALEAGPSAEGQAFNVSSGQMLPIREIVEAVCAAHDVPVRWRNLPLTPALLAARAAASFALLRSGGREPKITPYAVGLFAFRQSLNLDKARDVLGWRPNVAFDDGLARVMEGA